MILEHQDLAALDNHDGLEEIRERLERLESLLIHPVKLPFKQLVSTATLPKKGGPLEACYDITCVRDDDFFITGQRIYGLILHPGESHVFHTGLACAVPEGRNVYLWDRSGMGAKRNIHRLAGVIDCTYRGEWKVSLINLSKQVQTIHEGDRIVQAQLALVIPGEPCWTDKLPESYRGEKGFGELTGD